MLRTISQAALHFHVSEAMIQGLIDQGFTPSIKITSGIESETFVDMEGTTFPAPQSKAALTSFFERSKNTVIRKLTRDRMMTYRGLIRYMSSRKCTAVILKEILSQLEAENLIFRPDPKTIIWKENSSENNLVNLSK